MSDKTPSLAVAKQLALRLSNEALAERLERMALDPRWPSSMQRACYLNEAANRLRQHERNRQ